MGTGAHTSVGGSLSPLAGCRGSRAQELAVQLPYIYVTLSCGGFGLIADGPIHAFQKVCSPIESTHLICFVLVDGPLVAMVWGLC